MNTVFVVVGSTGENDDYVEWLVRAFGTHEEAEAFLALARQGYKAARKACRERSGERVEYWYMHLRAGDNPHDPGMHGDYNGVEYLVREVPFGPEGEGEKG